MGWFWHSPPRSPADGKPAPASSSSAQETPPSQTPTKAQRNDDPEMDPEIAKFLELFQAEFRGGSKTSDDNRPENPSATTSQSGDSSSPSSPPSSSSSSSWFSWGRSNPTPSPSSPSESTTSSRAATTTTSQATSPEEDLAISLLPTTMSCRQAFDQAFHCNGVGGQWNAIYRHGSVRDCSELWDDFWFCMRTKSYPTAQKAAAIRERYRLKEQAKYGPGKPSSEDVWRSRGKKVEPGAAFASAVEPFAQDVDDVEWNRVENERRRRIREALEFQPS